MLYFMGLIERSGPDNKDAITLVPGNCSKIILMNTVMGMAIIRPGIPHINPQSINIIRTVITFIEKDFPMKIGSKIAPNNTCTPVIERIKKNSVLVGSSSTKAKIDKSMTEINEPTICTKLIRKAKSPQKIGKLTSKNTQANPVNIPVNKLTKNLTLMNVIKSFSIFINAFIDVCFRFKMVLFITLCILIDSDNHKMVKKVIINMLVRNFRIKSNVEPMLSFSKN